ncbi:hypothetical protein A2U01_0089315, partial [Trifolium medium]|nr:hypothetical protein [Trifolium medium]
CDSIGYSICPLRVPGFQLVSELRTPQSAYYRPGELHHINLIVHR